MQNNLVIVESPAKAKTIEKFLGEGYKVLSSYGHIRDLKQKAFSIDIKSHFKPIYEESYRFSFPTHAHRFHVCTIR